LKPSRGEGKKPKQHQKQKSEQGEKTVLGKAKSNNPHHPTNSQKPPNEGKGAGQKGFHIKKKRVEKGKKKIRQNQLDWGSHQI